MLWPDYCQFKFLMHKLVHFLEPNETLKSIHSNAKKIIQTLL